LKGFARGEDFVIKDSRRFDKEAYVARLRMLRKLYGENQVEFARRLGIPFKRWNHYERGFPASRETAFLLWFQEGISSNWLWYGARGDMDEAILKRLLKLETDENRLAEQLRREEALLHSPPPPKVSVLLNNRKKKRGPTR
jgi:transcriptional regulator with XRE-family HTH domain